MTSDENWFPGAPDLSYRIDDNPFFNTELDNLIRSEERAATLGNKEFIFDKSSHNDGECYDDTSRESSNIDDDVDVSNVCFQTLLKILLNIVGLQTPAKFSLISLS